jgi:hypothetical protein
MISGLKGTTYDEKLKELGITIWRNGGTSQTWSRHSTSCMDMTELTVFVRADQTNLTTRSATGPLNLRQQAARLEVRRNFFSIRVVEKRNKIPSTIKMASSMTSFKNRYKKQSGHGGTVPT